MPLDQGNAAYQEMGPDLLASQPASIPETTYLKLITTEKWALLFDHSERRLNSLRNWRWSWWAHWSQLAAYLMPRRYKWVVTANTMNRGNPINDQIIDCSPTMALEICSSGMWSGITPPSRKWFKLKPALEGVALDQDGKIYLEQIEQKVSAVLAGSNFYDTMAQMFEDLAGFGTAPIIVYEDDEDVIRLYLPCAGEYFLAAGARFSPDTLFREFTLTIAQIVEQFTLKGCPAAVRVLWEEGGAALDQEYVVCHAIEPNFALSGRGATSGRNVTVLSGDFTWRETYWLKGQKTEQPLSLRGFEGQPFAAFRWSVVSNDSYGRCPGMTALGDSKQIQLQTLRAAELTDKLVRPPMLADPELKNEPSSINPGAITYVSTANAKKGFSAAFEVNPQGLPAMIAGVEKVQQRVDRAFFVDVFMAITRMQGVQPRNELELSKRDLERLQQLGPVIQLVEGQLSVLIRRVLDVMAKRGMVPAPPPSLGKTVLKIDYDNILRLAQKASKAVGMKDFMQTMGAMSSGAKASGVPDPARIVDWDSMGREYADLTDVGAHLIFPQNVVHQHDQIRTEEMQKAKQEAQVPALTQQAVQAAHDLGNTPLNNGSALDALVGKGAYPGKV